MDFRLFAIVFVLMACLPTEAADGTSASATRADPRATLAAARKSLAEPSIGLEERLNALLDAGVASEVLNQPTEAESYYRRYIELETNPTNAAGVMNDVARIVLARDPAEAASLRMDALESLGNSPFVGPGGLAVQCATIAQALLLAGRQANAESFFLAAVSWLDSAGTDDRGATPLVLEPFVEFLASVNDPRAEEVRRRLDKFYEERDSAPPREASRQPLSHLEVTLMDVT